MTFVNTTVVQRPQEYSCLLCLFLCTELQPVGWYQSLCSSSVKAGQGIQNKAHYEYITIGRPNKRWTGQHPPKWGTSENSLHTAAAAAAAAVAAAADDDDDFDEGTNLFERFAILLLTIGTRFKLALIVRSSL